MTDLLKELSAVFVAYLKREGITEEGDAQELLMGAALTPKQRYWLRAFVALWNEEENNV